MRRVLTISGVAVLIVLACLIAVNFARNPIGERRAWLQQRLGEVPPAAETAATLTQEDMSARQRAIAAKPQLWKQLVPPPPPQSATPDLSAMMQGVTATRQQIGEKVKFITPTAPRGVFLGQGEALNGLTLKTISPKEVLFFLTQDGTEYTLSMPRQ